METKELIIAIPCYKREEEVLETVKQYAKLDVDIMIYTQEYSSKFFVGLQKISSVGSIYTMRHSATPPIGLVRKEMLTFIDKCTDTKYKYILMHDNDFRFTQEDLDVLRTIAEQRPEYYVFSPDINLFCTTEPVGIPSSKCFGAQYMRADKALQIYSNLSPAEANEDSELIYLLENKGFLVRIDLFSFEGKDFTKETTYSDKLGKLERGAKFLQEKYGKEIVEVIVRPSGKWITTFNYNSKFPMKLRFGEKPRTEFFNSENSIKITMTNYPQGNFRFRCHAMSKSTWIDEPITKASETEVNETFKNILLGKMLPNSMEHLVFTFLIEGLNLITISHLLRHRTFFSIMAQCSSDRFLTHDSAFIPSSIENSKFCERYKQITKDAIQLYQDIADSKEVSTMDARYILPRNSRYFYYVSMNLKDLIAFIQQRKCEAIQPEEDNIIAHKLYDLVCSVIPELKETVSMECGANCFFNKSDKMDNSRIYQPNKQHATFLKDKYKPSDYIYNKTRKEMGVKFNRQD